MVMPWQDDFGKLTDNEDYLDNLFNDEPKIPGGTNPLIDNLINPDNKFDPDQLKPNGGNNGLNNGGNGDQNELPIPIDWFEPEKVDDKSIEEILSENPDSYGIDDDILEKLGFKAPPEEEDFDMDF